MEPFESDSMAAHENANGVVWGVLTRLGVRTGQTVGFSLLFRVRDRKIISFLGSQGRLAGAPVEVSRRWNPWALRTGRWDVTFDYTMPDASLDAMNELCADLLHLHAYPGVWFLGIAPADLEQ